MDAKKMSDQNNSSQNSFRSLILPWFSPAGAVLVIICFFLPWLEVRCSGKKIIGSGLTFANKAFPLWAILVFAVIVLLLFVWLKRGLSLKWFKLGTIFSASFGLFMMILTYWGIEKKLSGFFVRKIINHEVKIGLIGTLIGFIVTIIAAALSKKSLE